MIRIIKLTLTALFMIPAFLTWTEPMYVLKVEAAEETIDSELVIDEAILKVDVYLSEYLRDFPSDDLVTEKTDLNEYITKKLEADYFTEEEIEKVFEVMAEKRQKELLALVEVYLDEEPLLSRNALILQLKENHYSQKEVEQGFESIDVNWKEQAVKASEEYINAKVEVEEESYSIISRKSLRQFLVEEKDFSRVEATYGVEESAIDWDEQAFKQAEYFLATGAYSKKGLIEKLIAEEFTKEEAEFGVVKTQTNWKEEAVKKAKSYFTHSLPQSKKELTSHLEQAGFTKEEMEYALNLVFEKADESKVEVPSVGIPAVSAPERPIIMKPIEFITNHTVVSAQAATNSNTDSMNLSVKDPTTTITKRSQSSNKATTRAPEVEIEEDAEETEETSLFDNPVFTPVVMVLIIGNLYLFQKT